MMLPTLINIGGIQYNFQFDEEYTSFREDVPMSTVIRGWKYVCISYGATVFFRVFPSDHNHSSKVQDKEIPYLRSAGFISRQYGDENKALCVEGDSVSLRRMSPKACSRDADNEPIRKACMKFDMNNNRGLSSR